MRLKMIGTGAISAPARSACCLIDDEILIDCGNGTVKTLLEQSVDVNNINTLLITHLHGDHFLDLPFLILQRNFDSASNSLNIYCPIGTENTIAKIFQLIYPDIKEWTIFRDKTNIKFIEFKSLDNIKIANDYFVTSHLVTHGNFTPAYGFVIKKGDRAIGFSGDSAYCKSIDKIIEDSNLSILDMSFIDNNKKHMNVHDIEMLAHKYPHKNIIPTHMSQPAREYALKNKINNITILSDDDEIEI